MENTVSDNTTGLLNKPVAVIAGEVEAGQAAKVRKQLQTLIKGINTSTFDIMDLLHEVKTKKYYQPKFETFMDYAKTLELKVTKAYYLVRIKENMDIAGVARETYEPIGIAKLRVIASVDVVDHEGQIKMDAVEKVKTLVAKAVVTEPTDLRAEIDEFNGNVGEEAFDWLNIKIKKSAKAVVRKAFDLIKMQIGTVGKDSEGMSKDASDGNALEKMAMDYLSDPNNAPAIAQLGGDNETNKD